MISIGKHEHKRAIDTKDKGSKRSTPRSFFSSSFRPMRPTTHVATATAPNPSD